MNPEVVVMRNRDDLFDLNILDDGQLHKPAFEVIISCHELDGPFVKFIEFNIANIFDSLLYLPGHLKYPSLKDNFLLHKSLTILPYNKLERKNGNDSSLWYIVQVYRIW